MDLVSLADVRRAAAHLHGIAVRTPLLPSAWASGALWLKPESLQPVGAFKLRGAYNAMAELSDEQRHAGVVTHSSGNHARALAYAARMFEVPCVVVMPETAPPTKVASTRALGAEIVVVPPAQRLARATEIATARGLTMIPPFDHPDVIAGQGTVGLEIVTDLADVELVLVPVGGGGLASGVVTAVKAVCPTAKVIGVEPALAADAAESLAAGEVRVWPEERTYRTIADGLRTALSPLTFAHLSERLDGIVTVGEEEIISAIRTLVHEAHLVIEPSGAVTVAAYLYHRAVLPRGRTVAVLSGGNIEPAQLAAILADDRPSITGG